MVGCIVKVKWSNSIRPSPIGGRFRKTSSAEIEVVEIECECDENEVNRGARDSS